MGNNMGSSGRRNQSPNHDNTPPQQPEVSISNRYIFAATMPYGTYPNPNRPQYYHLPAPLDHHHRSRGDQRNPYSPLASPRGAPPVIEHQKAVAIRNDVNLKKETLVMEPDEENPGRYLVAFTFDAAVAGSITVLFFAEEGFECNLTPMKESLLAPVTVSFKDGLGQKFKQPTGTGIDFSLFEEFELIKEGETEVYPLAVKAEAFPIDKQGSAENNSMVTPNSQITQAVFEKKENGEYQVRVVKQILWVNGTRYELQEIYGIGTSVDGDCDGNDPGKECVICLSELRDTTLLPCRHMASFSPPDGNDPIVIDFTGMGKGEAWINGQSIGRYWPTNISPQNGCNSCNYRGSYNSDKCQKNCGKPSQQLYHLPRSMVQSGSNTIVLFEEMGGNPEQVSFAIKQVKSICGHVSESHPAPLVESNLPFKKTIMNSTALLKLECPYPNQLISSINFASFGTPVGKCGGFSHGQCSSVRALDVVKKGCLGLKSCSISVSINIFGDPCKKVIKSLAVEAACS